MSVDLGLPQLPAPPPAPRRQSRQVMVGSVPVGGGAPVSVQSMTTTLTADVDATLQQIAALTASGCQIVRVAVPSADDAEALPVIARKSQIPVIADIHFQPRYVFAAINAGCAAVRDPDPDRGQCRFAGPAPARQARQGDSRSAGGIGVVGMLSVRGARFPRHQDLG